MAKPAAIFRDVAEKAKWCGRKEYQVPLLICLKCQKFPCHDITQKDLQTLEESFFVERVFTGFSARRLRLYIFKHTDGTLTAAPAGFSLENPNMAQLDNVDEIYVVSKTMVKQTRLVVKDKVELANIRQSRSTQQK